VHILSYLYYTVLRVSVEPPSVKLLFSTKA